MGDGGQKPLHLPGSGRVVVRSRPRREAQGPRAAIQDQEDLN